MRLLALGILLFVLLPLDARAYKRSTVAESDICLYWNERRFAWTLSTTGLEDEAARLGAIRRSFQTWEAVPCADVGFTELGTTSRTDLGYEPGSAVNQNLIVFRQGRCSEVAAGDPCLESEDGCSNEFNCWDALDAEHDDVIALTTTTYHNRTGEIVDADIEFNDSGSHHFTTTMSGPPCGGANASGCVGTDVENTATHEIGHFLGLDHSDDTSATMFVSAPVGEVEKRSLAPDDVEAICSIYPVGLPTVACVLPDRVAYASGCSCAATGGASLHGLALLLAGLFARRLRGRRSPPDGETG